ncbi:lipoprotein insertase outer membrane protein LolB [Undibacterium sp.]|uniref:lipoprotein insertase outer membrane protein LolB n=1 Tax=Undibacterium sp. TaxID=1914977 RepID=UPI00374CBE5B
MSSRRTIGTMLLSLALGLMMTGCASVASRPAGQPAPVRVYHEDVELSGRILVLYFQNNREQSLPGSFEWKQDKDSTKVTLFSPTGQTVATITEDASGATLVQSKQPPKHAASLDSLMRETLGWPMPIKGMRDWMQGFVRNANGERVAVPADNDASLSSDGWQLRYVSWQDDWSLPKRIDLNRTTEQAGNVTLRVVLEPQKEQ